MVYLIVLILILAGIYWYDYRNNTRGKIILYAIICLSLILIAGLRYRLGSDTPQYIKFFNNIHDLNHLSDMDYQRSRYAPGFVFLSALCKSIYNDVTLLFIVEAIIVNIAVFYFFWKNSKHCFFAILLYYLMLYTLFNMEIMREAIAVSIALFAWPFFKKGNWLLWYSAAILANFFHFSASIMLFLPLICLPGIKQIFILGKRTIWIWLLVCVIGFAIHTAFFRYIQLLALSDSISDRAQAYEKNILGSSYFSIIGILTYAMQFLIYPVVALWLIQKKKQRNISKQEFNKIDALVLASTYILILTFFIPILGRFNNYLIPFSLLVLSDWIFSPIKINRKIYKTNLISWFIIFVPLFIINARDKLFTDVNKSGTIKLYSLYYPYKSVLDMEKDENRERAIRLLRRKF